MSRFPDLGDRLTARRAAIRLDPAARFRLIGMRPDIWQASVVRSRPRRALLACGRQLGKSTTTAVAAVDQAEQQPGSHVLVCAPGARQSSELVRRIAAVLTALGPAGPPVKRQSVTAIEFVNGSRITSLPGTELAVRGLTADMVVVDEASRLADATFEALLGTLGSKGDEGRLILLSTPAGRRGFFYSLWERGGDEWMRVRVRADEIERVSPAFLAAARASMTAARYAQEFLASFEEDDQALWSAAAVEALFDDNLVPLDLGDTDDREGDDNDGIATR